ncbi:MAG: RHS repeat protein [Lachnospiraceae bacterium]|nr:RHS repeat protein [Lachnospiraceae bacterium]
MNRKKFFITIVAICVVLIAAEAGIMLGLFRKGRKKDENKPGNNVTVTTEAPSPTEIEVTEAPKPAAQELFGGFVPTPTPEAWVDRLELYPGDRRIEGTEEGYRDVWRVTEQRFYTMNDVFFWIEPRPFMEEPFMWSKEVDRNRLAETKVNSSLAGLINYTYDARGNLLSLREDIGLYRVNWEAQQYDITYDALFSPYVTVDFDGYSTPSPLLNHRYAYDTEGRIIHEWIEEREFYAGSYSDHGYPEYVYYYGDDGRLALREGYKKDGSLAESMWINYTFDEQGRISVYSEQSGYRCLTKEYAYDSNGNLSTITESYRCKLPDDDYDLVRQYNENGELVGKKKTYDYIEDGIRKTASFGFESVTGDDGQRVCKFDLDGMDGNPDYYTRTYEYDGNGNVTARNTYSPAGLLLYREEIKYEKFNVPISKLTDEERIKLKMYR